MDMKVISVDELERSLGDLSPAEKREVWIEKYGTTELEKLSKARALVNPRNGYVYDVVSNRYALIQHKDAFKPVLETLKTMGKNQVRAEFIQNKGRAWMSIVFPETTINDGQDGIEMGIQMKNSYESGMSLQITSTRSYYEGRFLTFFGYRRVCSNGMMVRVPWTEINKGAKVDEIRKEYVTEKEVGLGSFSTRIWHSGSSEKKMEQISRIVKTLTDCIPYIQTLVDKARQHHLEPEEASKMLEGIGLGKRMVEKVMKLYANDEQSRFGLYNSVTYYASHNAKTPMQVETQLLQASRLLV